MTEQPKPSPDDDFSVRTLFRKAPRGLRWSAYVAAGLALLMVGLVVTAAVFVRRPVPVTDGELELAGLDAEVEVIRDDHGIAQIYADTDADLMRAQGFVAAQDRFFEMDVRRHVTAGRLAELFGEDGLETDKYIRTMGWRRVAEEEWALLDTETRDALAAYADGVNAYLEQNGTSEIAVEYTILGLTGLDYEPEAWEPADSLAWLKAMAWDLRGNMDDEIARVMASLDHTPAEIAELYPSYDVRGAPADRRHGRCRGRGVRAERDRQLHPQPAPAGVQRGDRPGPGRSPGRAWTGSPSCSVAATASARTRGWSTVSTARPVSRCWPTTRTSGSASPASGCRPGCTAARSRPTARSTSPASPSPACPA